VSSDNIVRAVLYLVISLGGTAALFLMLGAAFVAWTVVLVYIGAVIILFLIGIMITRAPLGTATDLSHDRSVRVPAALLSVILFAVLAWAVWDAFHMIMIQPFEPTSTADLANILFDRFVIPFEVVSFVLLAALIGGITLARRDNTGAKR
jgi:NADH-quinone oxidoreductase subunit J